MVRGTPTGRESWTRGWGWLLVAGVSSLVVGLVAWLHLAAAGPEARMLVSDLGVLPVGFASTFLALRASRQASLPVGTRVVWRRLAAGFGAFWLGDVVWAVLEIGFGLEPFPSAADFGYVSFYPLVLWGLLAVPLALRTRADKLKFWLDALTVVLGGGTAIVYFVFVPVLAAAYEEWISAAVSLAYPVGDLLLLLGIATVLLRRPDPGTVGALRLLAAGLSLMIVSDIAFGPLVLQDAYQSGDWVDDFWILATLLLAISGQYQTWRAHRVDAKPAQRPAAVQILSPLPYLSVVVAAGLVVMAAFSEERALLPVVVMALVGVTGLVVARQFIAVRENARLIAEQAARRDALLRLAQRFGAEVLPELQEAEVLKAARALVGGDHAQIAKWAPACNALEPAQVECDTDRDAIRRMVDQAGAEAMLRGEPVVLTTAAGDRRGAELSTSDDDRAVVAVPVAHQGRQFGALSVCLTGPGARFDADDAQILGLLAGLAAATSVGVERALLEGALLAARTAEHELNNQLTAAAGFTQLLVESDDLPDELRPFAQDALDGALEAARLVGEIRQIRRVILRPSNLPGGSVIDLKHSAA